MDGVTEASNWKSNYPRGYPGRYVLRDKIPAGKVIRGRFARPVAAVLTYAVLPIAALITLIYVVVGHTVSWQLDLVIIGAVSVPMAFLSVILVFLFGNFGVVLTSNDVNVLGYTFSRKYLICHTAPWTDLQEVESWGLYSETIWIGHSNIALMVTPEEAHAILSDHRCPIHGRVPPRIARRIMDRS